mgnify:CR=1 FL=1
MNAGFSRACLYILFALVATACNLLSQRMVLSVWSGGTGFVVALVAGTGIGLLVKYALDKRWIFHDRETGLQAHGRKFSLYALMGVFTTLIFWGFEFGFDALFGTDVARYTGAVIGLAIGYVAKYHLDKNVTFSGPREEPA